MTGKVINQVESTLGIKNTWRQFFLQLCARCGNFSSGAGGKHGISLPHARWAYASGNRELQVLVMRSGEAVKDDET